MEETQTRIAQHLPRRPTLIEIGCGEGHFLRGLSETFGGDGRFIGFDPNSHPETGTGLEFHPRLFEPLTDVAEFAPDGIMIRHVVEHLTQPALFIEQLAWGAARLEKPCLLFAESPCIDRVFESLRLADFFYEHVSHFTTASFRELMGRAGDVVELGHGYDGEVVFALVRLTTPKARQARAAAASAFHQGAPESQAHIRAQLDALAAGGERLAIWGGTGKCAAFMHQYGVDAIRFPLVVDSDIDKAGSYVPGSGQRIEFRDVLKGRSIDVVIIPTQWRAKDIAAEMAREGIEPARILIEHGGRLIDYRTDPHPYR